MCLAKYLAINIFSVTVWREIVVNVDHITLFTREKKHES